MAELAAAATEITRFISGMMVRVEGDVTALLSI